MPRRSSSSSSSRRRSSESEDRTSSTSFTSFDGPDRGKGKERAAQYYLGEEESRGRRYPLSDPWPRNEQASSSKRVAQSAYPLSAHSTVKWWPGFSRASSSNAGRKRILHLVLALSIPVLGLLLANEIRISGQRARLNPSAPTANRTNEWEAVDLDVVPYSLKGLRREYAKKRRREAQQQREWQGAALPLLPSPDGPEWSEEDEASLIQEANLHWPTWWGNKDVVGASPYDHRPRASVGEKKRVLFLTSESFSPGLVIPQS